MFDDAFKMPNACRKTVPRDSDGMMSMVHEEGYGDESQCSTLGRAYTLCLLTETIVLRFQ